MNLAQKMASLIVVVQRGIMQFCSSEITIS